MKCLICPNETKTKKAITCSKKCAYQYRKLLLQEKHGVENPFQLQSVKDKSTNTILKKYGVSNVSKSDEIKKKKINTCHKNFGVDHPGQSLKVKEKIKEICLSKYGVENPMFDETIKNRSVTNGGGRAVPKRYITKYGNEIIVQGSYELDFVKECEQLNIPIKNGPCINYVFKGNNRKYFIDFTIEHTGTTKIVEIKSTYYFEKYKEEILCKKLFAEKYALENNMLYELIVLDKTRKERKYLLDELNKEK